MDKTESPRPIKVHIGELVLHGFEPHQRRQIAQAVQQEVARLLAAQGLPAVAGATVVERINAGSFRVPRGAPPEQTGSQIGQRIHAGLRRSAVRPK